MPKILTPEQKLIRDLKKDNDIIKIIKCKKCGKIYSIYSCWVDCRCDCDNWIFINKNVNRRNADMIFERK